MLVIADELINGLDSASRLELARNLRSIADAGGVVLVASHEVDDLSNFFDCKLHLTANALDVN